MNQPKKLAALCQGIITIPQEHNVLVNGLALDSRQVKSGYVFFAMPGHAFDGNDFISMAISEGASVILREKKPEHKAIEVLPSGITVFSVEDLTFKLGIIASRFFDNPSEKMTVIGVTGTNGKSSCCHYIATALSFLEISCGILGTVGNGFPGHLQKTTHTTLDAIHLQEMLQALWQKQAKAIAMEVSSHSLTQGRVSGCKIETAIFTNLTHEHLDYHGTFENYGRAKRMLFCMAGVKNAIINYDDPFGKKLLAEFSSRLHCIAYSMKETKLADDAIRLVAASDLTIHSQGMEFTLTIAGESVLVKSPLLGKFNVANLLTAAGYLTLLNTPLVTIADILGRLQGVRGRMQTLRQGKQPLVVIDYAHTPDALENALISTKEHAAGKLWCIFGCGGDRDKQKRPIMGEIAEKYANHIIVTNDNPRTENPHDIIDQILNGFNHRKPVIIPDRKEAILNALRQAHSEDVILIAGKGHEDYQEIGKEKIFFDDAQIVQEYWNQRL